MNIDEIKRSLAAAASDAERASNDAEDAARRADEAAEEIRDVLKALQSVQSVPITPDRVEHHDGSDPLTDAEILWTQTGYHVLQIGARWKVLHASLGHTVGTYDTRAEAQYVAYGCAMFGRPEQRP